MTIPKTEIITLDLSGSGGLAPRFFGDKAYQATSPNWWYRTVGGANQYTDGYLNPITFLGYMSPANNTFHSISTTANIISATTNDIVNSKGYFFEYTVNPTIYSIANYSASGMSFNRTLTGEHEGTDLQEYTINGVRQLFYSYRGASTTGNIGIFDYTSTYDVDWLSTAPVNAFNLGKNNHKMVVADNGFMYVLDGSFVHKVDGTTAGGTDGTVTANVLSFPATTQLVDGLDLGGFLWIALMENTLDLFANSTLGDGYTSKVGVYVWDRSSTVVSSIDFIPISGCKTIRTLFSFRGQPACFTVSSDDFTQLRIYNGRSFEVVKELPPQAYPRFPDSVHITSEFINWIAKNGKFYSYGRVHQTALDGLYRTGFTGSLNDSNGAMLSVDTASSSPSIEAYYLTFGTSIKKWFPHSVSSNIGGGATVAHKPHASNIYTLVQRLPKLSKLISITLFYPPIGSTGTDEVLKILMYFNQSSNAWASGGTVLTENDAIRGYKFIPVGEANVHALQLKFVWDTDINLSATITPSHAIVEYIPTNKKI